MIFSSSKDKQNTNYFLSQPHQPFFVLGVINAIVMMLIFALNYKGVLSLNVPTLFFHTYSLIYIVFINLFSGFLFTTFPRFTGMQPIDLAYYKNIFYLNTVGSVLFVLGSIFSIIVLVLSTFILLYANYKIVSKLYAIYSNSQASNLEDAYWILRAFQFGLVGNFLMILSLYFPSFSQFCIVFSFFMFVIFLTFSVAQRMIPFFSHSMQPKDHRFISTVFVLFVLKTIFATFNAYDYVKISEIVLDLLLSIYLLVEFLKWNMLEHKPLPILWILHLGLFWLPLAFFMDAISLIAELYMNTSFYFLGIHLLALGFLTTVLIGFGTRVTYGHSGQPPHAKGLVIGIFYFTQVVVLTRFLYSLNIGFSWNLNFLFDISFTMWLILFIVWGVKFLPVLIRGKKESI